MSTLGVGRLTAARVVNISCGRPQAAGGLGVGRQCDVWRPNSLVGFLHIYVASYLAVVVRFGGTGGTRGEGAEFLMGAKRGLRSCEILPTFYRNLLPALISKNLDDLLCLPVTVGKCNAFGGERIAANLRSLQFPGEAADHMTTLPAARAGFSETHNLEFETQKREIESLSV